MIAVTGATGFVGRPVLKMLREYGFRAVGIGRHSENVDRTISDMAVSPDWQSALEGVTTVIHCAAIAHVPIGSGAEQHDRLHRVNVDAVANLADACLEAGVGRLIFLSSAKVYGESSTGCLPFREEDEPNPGDAYGKTKLLAEQALQDRKSDRLQVCALRMPLVFGQGAKGNVYRLQRLVASGVPLPFSAVRNRRSMLSLEYLGQVVRMLLATPEWPYTQINVADSPAMSLPEFVQCVASINGGRARLFPFPVPLLRVTLAALGGHELVSRLLGDFELDTRRLQALMARHSSLGIERRAGESLDCGIQVG